MDKLKYLMRTFLLYQKLNFSSFMSYQLSFLTWIIGSFLETLLSIVSIKFIFQSVNSINDWTFMDILFLMAMLFLSRALWHSFFINTLDIGYYIRTGELDRGILLPVPTLFHILNKGRYNYELDWEDFVIGLFLITTTIIINWDKYISCRLLFLPVAILCGGLIYAAIVFIISMSSFQTVKTSGIIDFFQSTKELALYPLNIYNDFIRYALTFILPFGFINYFSCSFILFGSHKYYAFASIFVTIILWIIALLIWKYNLKKHQSVGG